MVDFGKLRIQQQIARPIHPEEVFLRLPKSSGINDLWNGQAEALRTWHCKRHAKDIVLKLNTGGGKTLVGLIIGLSILNEKKKPVLYLCPNRQLQEQVIRESQKYGIPTVAYTKGPGFPNDFLAGRAVMISTYHALFNGQSKFGLAESTVHEELGGIILDDAHAAFSIMRDIFTLAIEKSAHTSLYEELVGQFRGDFDTQSRQGTFDDVIAGRESSVLEVPYIAWTNRALEVRQRLAELAQDRFPFVWPLIRDSFHQSYALISKDRFTITPYLPLVGRFPSFTGCPHRIYMSATFADDSSLIRTFDATLEAVSQPIFPTSLAGVGERMVLAPELMPPLGYDHRRLAGYLAKKVANSAGVAILSPSKSRAERWKDVATFVDKENVALAVNALRERVENGPFVIPNRYDGIDLPDDSCRLLIVSGLPMGTNDYELYRAKVLEGSSTINAALAQKIEQGMGRGTRGGGDHCVVLLLGRKLVGWISRTENLKLLTDLTQAQVNMGVDICNNIRSLGDLEETMDKCLSRSTDWTKYHANVLADSAVSRKIDDRILIIAKAERKYFRLATDGYLQKATTLVEDFARKTAGIDPKLKGWLLELGARSAHRDGDFEKRERLQHEAFSYNKNLHRPVSQTRYIPLRAPTKQAERVVKHITSFDLKLGVIMEFEDFVSRLVPSATSGQFEEALKDLGGVLGFVTQRPENELNIGPDVLWLLNSATAWTIEAKSKKDPDGRLKKDEHGQLLQALVWSREFYPDMKHVGVVVHPTANATESVTVGETLALTLPKLGELVASTRTLLTELISEPSDRPTMEARCESKLLDLDLSPGRIERRYLSPFVSMEKAS